MSGRRAIKQRTYFMNILQRFTVRLKSRIRSTLIKLLKPIVRELTNVELQALDDRQQKRLNQRLTVDSLSPTVQEIINTQIRVWGDRSKLRLAPSAQMVNTLFNLSSGLIEIGDHTFTGHNVSIITGTHQYTSRLEARVTNVPTSGRDIIIGRGVWIGSNAIILGPCTIGDHAVIAAGAVITSGSDIPSGAIVAGIPAKVIKTIETL